MRREGKNDIKQPLEKEDLLVQAMDQGPNPVVITDGNGKIVYVNKKFVKFTGYGAEEMLGENPRVLSAGRTPPETYKHLWATILSGQVWQGELCNKRKNGEVFWESISIAPVKDRQGRVTHFVGMWHDSTERKSREEKMTTDLKEFEHQSITDELTGQYNRRHILSELEREIERSKRYGRQLSGMMIDIDNFKMINDRHGHLVGDRVIRTFAAVLRKSIRKVDVLGRYGGDEFLVILPEATLEISRLVAQRIQENLSEYDENVLGALGKLTASIGLFSFENIAKVNQNAFIEKIDRALLLSKQAGKNTITVG